MLRWEYLGAEPPLWVIILRRSGPRFDSLDVVNGSASVSDNRFVDSYSDQSPFSGELLEYSVSARTRLGLIDARAVQVQIPGARLLRLRRNPFTGIVQIDWQSFGSDISSFELVRFAEQVSTSLVVTGPGQDTFVDETVEGNTAYTYQIVTQLQGGARLMSRVLSAKVYSLARTEAVAGGSGLTVVSGGSAVSSATMLALTGEPGDIDISKYRYFFGTSFDGSQSVGAIREETVSTGLDSVDPSSLDLAGPSPAAPSSASERVFVIGRNVSGTSAVIRGFGLPNLNPVWDGPQDWNLTDTSTPVVATQGGDGLIYFSADRKLRAYTSDLFELAAFDLPFAQPTDIHGNSDYLWGVIGAENRIVRTDVSTGLAPTLTWQGVDLAVDGSFSPTALTFNRFGQLFVLDGLARRVHAFDTDLSPILSWDLPAEDFTTGGIALDGGNGNLVHVTSNGGIVYTYLP